MNAHACCQKDRPAPKAARHPKSWSVRARKVAGYVVPGTLLALLPKCPICLAAYVALGTGFTLSYASAHILLRTLTVLCLGALALCVTRGLLNCSSRKQTINVQPTPARS